MMVVEVPVMPPTTGVPLLVATLSLLLLLVFRLPPLPLLRVPMRVEMTSMGGNATVDCSVRSWSRS